MSKASRKIQRYETKQADKITEKDISEQYGKKGFFGEVVEGLNLFEWVGLTWQNILIMLGIYILVAVTIENALNKVTIATSAGLLSHGLITSLLIVAFFTYVRKKDPSKQVTTKEFLFRYFGVGVILALMSVFTNLIFK